MKPDHFILQPVYSGTGRLLYAEVLARFDGCNTQEVIIAAEKSGEIVEIDLAGMLFGRSAAVPVAVNISTRTLESNLVAIGEMVRPGMTLEITETHPSNLKTLRNFAFEVHARGGQISIDDVGSGEFSDPEWIKEVVKATSANWIKLPIDASKDLIDLCHSLRAPLIVERVETKSDLEFALGFGGFGLQGWFFEKQAGADWLREQRMCHVNRDFDEVSLAMAC